MKKGEIVSVWGRLAVVKKLRLDGRVQLELLDGDDPPAGYQACWLREDIEGAPDEHQLRLSFYGGPA